MDIPEKLMNFKVPILFGTISSTLILFLIYLAPSLLDILNFFWPLLVSTALFLVAILVFGRISPPPAEATDEKSGEGILDYVTAQPENVQPPVDGGDSEEEEEAAASAASASAKGKGKAEKDE